jgi:hypothetical protein
MEASTNAVQTDVPPDREALRKMGRRVLRAGDIVKIKGAGGHFRIRHFRGREVEVFGGRPNHTRIRTFTVDRIGRRPRNGAELRPDLAARG